MKPTRKISTQRIPDASLFGLLQTRLLHKAPSRRTTSTTDTLHSASKDNGTAGYRIPRFPNNIAARDRGNHHVDVLRIKQSGRAASFLCAASLFVFYALPWQPAFRRAAASQPASNAVGVAGQPARQDGPRPEQCACPSQSLTASQSNGCRGLLGVPTPLQLSSSHQAPLIPVLVCHVVHAPHEALLRADKREVGHVACVQARVAFHLVCKAAVLVARLEQLPPHRVELLVVLRQQARMARLEAVSPAPQLIQQLHVFDVALRVARHRVLRGDRNEESNEAGGTGGMGGGGCPGLGVIAA
eukprot:353467-Chlamydomonas_euryale.AAC.3